MLGIPLSPGSVRNVWEGVSAAVAEPYDELARKLPQEPVLNSDETGYRTNGEKTLAVGRLGSQSPAPRMDVSRDLAVVG
jgi:hypothetical protein